MKKIFFAITTVMLFITGCNSDFLDTKPAALLSSANFWKTSEHAKSGINAIYDQMQRNIYIYQYHPLTDGMTPNAYLWSNYTHGYQAIAKGTSVLPSTTTPFRDKWNGLYNGIYRANLAISKIPEIAFDETLKNRFIAEARFLRALFYYNLADFYGGAPIIKEIIELGAELPARNTREEVLNFVISECTEAASYLPASYDASDKGRVTQGAALTLKTKAYLLGNKFSEAANTAKQVMDLGKYQLYNNYGDMFTSIAAENNSEVIFDIQYAGPGLGEGNLMDKFIAPNNSYGKGWNHMQPTIDMVNSYEMANGKMITDPGSGYDAANPYTNRDPRLAATIITPGSTWKGMAYTSIKTDGASYYLGYLPRKYVLTVDGYANGDSPLNFILFRYADVLLMYAEAKNEVDGPVAEVYSAINLVRARPGVNMPPVPAGKTQNEMREIIRHERRIELAFEGIYYSDIRRWGIAKVLNNGFVIRKINGQLLETRAFVDAFYLWPVPQAEIDLNPKLEQNSGY